MQKKCLNIILHGTLQPLSGTQKSSVQTRDWSWGIYKGYLSTWWDQNLVEDTDAVVAHFVPYAQRYMLDIYGGYSFFPEMKPRWNRTQQRNFDKERFKFYLKKIRKEQSPSRNFFGCNFLIVKQMFG